MPPSRSWFERVAEARVARRAPDVETRFNTRAKVEPPRRFACHRCGKAAPCARPARWKGDRAGRSPGLRVVTLAPPSQACAQWHLEEGSPPTVAGAAPDLTRGFRAAPDSLLAGRGRHTCTERAEWDRCRALSTRGGSSRAPKPSPATGEGSEYAARCYANSVTATAATSPARNCSPCRRGRCSRKPGREK